MKELVNSIKQFLKTGNIKQFIIELVNNGVVKYIFFGVLTTLVNFGMFYFLHKILSVRVFSANAMSIACAVVFAYFVNARFVFSSQVSGAKAVLKEMAIFIGARLSTIILELFGVLLLVDVLKFDALLSKIAINVIVLIVNYVLSALIFKNKSNGTKNSF